MIDYYTVLQVTDDEGEIQLLINIRYTVIVSDTDSPILTMPHSTILVLCETNVRYYQYKIEETAQHYL